MSSEDKNPKHEYCKVLKEFIPDLLTTFPEYKDNLHQGIIDIFNDELESENVEHLYNHSKAILPVRFFDILYQNADMFNDETIDTEFIPNIKFSELWSQDITDNTRNVIWKYLQLMTFSLITDLNDETSFGDAANLFQAINEDEFKDKLQETMEGMQGFFTNLQTENSEEGSDISNINLENLPNPEDIHSHINGMLDGKLGRLAREIAEETAQELDFDLEDASSVGDVFKQLFKNPGKLMGIVKSVGNKLETKIKSGAIQESELIKETTEMMAKMQSMPGMGDIKGMLSQFGLPAGRNMKMNMGAFQSQMNQNLRSAQMKERMNKKLEQKRASNECFSSENTIENTIGTSNKVFSKGDAPEKSKRIRKGDVASASTNDFSDSITFQVLEDKNTKKPKDANKKKKKNKNKK